MPRDEALTRSRAGLRYMRAVLYPSREGMFSKSI
jgi:hypothetical protein